MQKLKNYAQRILKFFSSGWSIKKGLVVVGTTIGSIALIIVLLFLFILFGGTGSLPNRQELLAIENPAASEVFSADSVLLGRFFIQERSNLRFNELPASAVNALLATEDVRFYQHGAIDFRSFGRVFFKSFLLQQDASGGGSTLSQQLVKNLFPRRSYRSLPSSSTSAVK